MPVGVKFFGNVVFRFSAGVSFESADSQRLFLFLVGSSDPRSGPHALRSSTNSGDVVTAAIAPPTFCRAARALRASVIGSKRPTVFTVPPSSPHPAPGPSDAKRPTPPAKLIDELTARGACPGRPEPHGSRWTEGWMVFAVHWRSSFGVGRATARAGQERSQRTREFAP